MKPSHTNIENASQVWDTVYGKRISRTEKDRTRAHFEVGDKVRLNEKARTFQKEYLLGWTQEVFIVSHVVPGLVNTYRGKERDDSSGQGTFHEQDIQKGEVPDGARF